MSQILNLLNHNRLVIEQKETFFKKHLQAMSKKILKKNSLIKKVSIAIQALEASKNVLLTTITELTNDTQKVVDKNNYTSYANQVISAYDMYESKAAYGSEILGSIVDMRVACICGEGINFSTTNKKKKVYIENFLKANKLQGSELLKCVTTGELEGKCLLLLHPKIIKNSGVFGGNIADVNKSYIAVDELSWVNSEYRVSYTNNILSKIDYKQDNKKDEWISIDLKTSVYVKLAGTNRYINETTNRIHRVLTQFENLSRALYDLRMVSHLHGSPKPVWNFDHSDPDLNANITALEKQLNTTNYDITQGAITTGDFKFVSPDANAVNIILKDILENLRVISSNTGIPIHWLSYPELMSNRATAENISKTLEFSTKKERLIWEEAIKELIEKSMYVAIESGIASNDILEGDFDIKLPLIDLAQVIEMMKELYVLVKDNFLPASYLYNRLPGTDPEKIKEEIALQKETQKNEMQDYVKNESAIRLQELNNEELDEEFDDEKDIKE